MRAGFEVNGYAIARNFLNSEELRLLTEHCEPVADQYGVRNFLQRFPLVRQLLFTPKLHALLRSFGYPFAVPVRSLFFNKNESHNWLVPWHQDLSIAVNQKADMAGYAKWTFKDDTHYVEPPVELLNSILTLRFALDDTDENNGALKVIAGSHLSGKLDSAQIRLASEKELPVSYLSMQAGDLLLMKPLLLHASSKALATSNRRVVHLELSAEVLPAPLAWAEY
ncbi:hypothetical protein GCM10011396_01850 [Undibacterium terreum]|uniref:Phytanoyl-CoA dioxygenase (PhyH) n=2 Tax=Undibacterium terreum TaxID=1224302 RepID=A0A916U3F1_9BURK|nr:hypothetical protein GCM10011396_01850 [Undibacterium terreum]